MRTQIVFIYSIYQSLKKVIFFDKYQSQKFSALGTPRQRPPCAPCLPRETPSSSPPVVGIFASPSARPKYRANLEPLGLQQNQHSPLPPLVRFANPSVDGAEGRAEPIPHSPGSAGTLAFTRSPWGAQAPSHRAPDGVKAASLGKPQKTSRAIASHQTQSNLTNSKFKMTNNKVSSLIIHIKATFNNTLLTLTNFKGQVITWVSAGSCGFKGARKGTPFAAKKVVEIFMKKSNDYFRRCDQIKIYVCGVGPGRENAIRGLAAISKTIQQGTPKAKTQRMNKAAKLSNKIVLIREMTKIPHNGCRPTKKRRI